MMLMQSRAANGSARFGKFVSKCDKFIAKSKKSYSFSIKIV